MSWESPLIEAVFVRRYKRFFAEFTLADGTEVVAHCANTGRMTGLVHSGARAWLRRQLPGRKLEYAWELVETPEGLACVHTGRANAVLAQRPPLDWWGAVTAVRREPVLGTHRLDFAYQLTDGRTAFIEVKTVTWCIHGQGFFPDAPSTRATAHLGILADLASQAIPVGLVFLAMHNGIRTVAPAESIDPGFCEALRRAVDCGVQIGALGTQISPEGIVVTDPIVVVLSPPAESPGNQCHGDTLRR